MNNKTMKVLINKIIDSNEDNYFLAHHALIVIVSECGASNIAMEMKTYPYKKQKKFLSLLKELKIEAPFYGFVEQVDNIEHQIKYSNSFLRQQIRIILKQLLIGVPAVLIGRYYDLSYFEIGSILFAYYLTFSLTKLKERAIKNNDLILKIINKETIEEELKFYRSQLKKEKWIGLKN